MASYQVDYWTTPKNGVEGNKVTSACFSGLGYGGENLKSIRYLCKVDPAINDEMVDFYLNFLKGVLTTREWTFKKVGADKEKEVEFILDCANWNRQNVLLYLTAFRIVWEYPEIVLEFFKYKDLPLDKQFEKFQEVHQDSYDGKIKLLKFGNLSGHGLMCYYGANNREPIAIDEFQERLKKQANNSVNSYFINQKPPPPPKPVPPPVPLMPVEKLIHNPAIFA